MAPGYASNPPRAVGYFYNDLRPYGAWVTIEGVGWRWQPRVALPPGWRPYCNSGHWVWTSAGWCWQSDYPWGWAAFHYGRWSLHSGRGWVWVPDTMWAPAWVTWRVYGDQCGWAPLPLGADCDVRLGLRFNGVSVGLGFGFGLGPEQFTFVGLRDIQERDLARRRLPAAEVARIYNRARIVNSRVVNHAIVNRGVAVERVTAVTHRPVEKAAIRDTPGGSARASGTPGAEKGQAVVYRPKLAAPARPASMVAQKVDPRHPVIQHASAAPARAERKAAPARNIGPRATTGKPAAAPNVRQPEPRAAVNKSAPAPSQGARNYLPKSAQQARELRPAPQRSETKK